MKRYQKILLWGLGSIAVLCLVFWLGLHFFFQSSYVRNIASDRISEIIGLPVEVEELSIGGASSEVKLKVFAPAEEENGKPVEFATISSVSTDVSATDLVTGRADPQMIQLKRAAINLKVDRDGKLLLPSLNGKGGTLPNRLPNIKIENGSITIHQEGRPAFQIAGIDINTKITDRQIEITGTANDPQWGSWKVSGLINIEQKTGFVKLDTDQGTLRSELLHSIPFVPLATWKHVDATGQTPASVRLELGKDQQFQYAVQLQPNAKANLTLPDIDSTLTNVAGTIRITGKQVEILDCQANIADGKVHVQSTLDFSPEPSRLNFQIQTESVNIQKLPTDWGLPQQISGFLRGKANLELLVHADGTIEPKGTGSGTVEQAKIAGLPAEIRLRLRGDGKRYRFDSEQPPDANDKIRGPRAPVVQDPPKSDDSKPTNFDATVTLKDVDVAELLTRLNYKLPYHLDGKVTVKFNASVPIGGVADQRSYRFQGTISSPKFRFEGFEVKSFAAEVRYRNGLLTLSSLTGLIPSADQSNGSFRGTASAQVDPKGELRADLDLKEIPIREVLKAIPNAHVNMNGRVNGNAKVKSDVEKLTDIKSWSGTATLTSSNLELSGRSVQSILIDGKLDQGIFQLTHADAVIEGLPLTSSGQFNLSQPYPFSLKANTKPTETDDFRRLIPEARLPFAASGKLDTASEISGDLQSWKFNASGTAHLTDLKLGSSEGNAASFRWETNSETIQIKDLQAQMFKGSISGSSKIPLNSNEAGTLDVSFKDVDSDALTRLVPDFPVPLSGRITGHVKVEANKKIGSEDYSISSDLELTAPRLTVHGVPAERLAGKVTIVKGVAEYQLEGRALGGTFDVKGHYPSQKKEKNEKPDRGHVRLQKFDLSRLAKAIGIEGIKDLQGLVDVSFEYDADFANGSGRFAITGLKWARNSIAENLSGTIQLRNGLLDIRDVTGRIAGGTIRIRARYDLEDSQRNFYTITLDRLDLRRFGQLIYGRPDGNEGEMTLTIRGRPGTSNRGTVTITISSGQLNGLAISDVRIPIDWEGGHERGQLTIREGIARIGEGRLAINAEYIYGSSSKLSGNIKFNDIRMRLLISGASSVLGNGRMTGRFDLAGQTIRSIDDISGSLTATLNQASVREIPLIQVITPYLSPTNLLSPFEAGEVKGRLAKGIFRIERLGLSNPGAQVYAEGSITRKGNVDLDIVAATGQVGPNVRALRLLGLRLPTMIGPLPVTLIKEVSDLLSNRTIRLSVTGTVKTPIVRVNTAALLTDTAARFFLGQYLPDPLSDK